MSSRGQITIEMAIVFPFICLVLLGVLEFGIYLHDKLVCTALLHQYAHAYPLTDDMLLNPLARTLVKGNKMPHIYVSHETNFFAYQDIEVKLDYDYKLLGIDKHFSMKVMKTNMKPRQLIMLVDAIDDLSENISMTKTYKDTLKGHIDKLDAFLNP